jgi:hypothetical protein
VVPHRAWSLTASLAALLCHHLGKSNKRKKENEEEKNISQKKKKNRTEKTIHHSKIVLQQQREKEGWDRRGDQTTLTLQLILHKLRINAPLNLQEERNVSVSNDFH